MVANMSRAYEGNDDRSSWASPTQGELGMVAQLEGLNWPRASSHSCKEPPRRSMAHTGYRAVRYLRGAILAHPVSFHLANTRPRWSAPFKIRAVALADETLTPPPSAVLSHRPLGAGSWQAAAMGRVTPGREVPVRAELPLRMWRDF